MSTDNENIVVIFNIRDEEKVLSKLFKENLRLHWGGSYNKEIITYYKHATKNMKCPCTVGAFIIKHGRELFWSENVLKIKLNAFLKGYPNSKIIDLRIEEDIELSTKDIYVCDKENKVYYLKEVRMLENPKKVCLSFSSGDRLFNSIEEANEQFYVC